jgi:cell division protein FtsI (penicillin-binding protein 3)
MPNQNDYYQDERDNQRERTSLPPKPAQKPALKSNPVPPNSTRRIRIGLLAMLSLLTIVGGKLVLVQVVDVDKNAEAALASRLNTVDIPAQRGKIISADGRTLADSVIRFDLTVDQKVNTENETFERIETVDGKKQLVEVTRDQGIAELAEILGQDPAELHNILTGDKSYALVAKDIKPDVEAKISAMNIPGIFSVGTSKRVYPLGSVAGGVVGFIQSGGTGQAGLEQTQEERLTGEAGKRTFEIGADGLRIPVATDELIPAVNGDNVNITINSDLQYYAQQAIQNQTDKLQAEWGSIIVSDAKTGAILAMADTNAPDPNNPGAVGPENRGVRSVTAAYEPGSVQKMLTTAALIEEGKASPLEVFSTPRSYTVNGQTFTDAFEHGTEERTLAGIFGYSMNTGTVMAGQRLTKQERYDWFKKFGIGEPTNIGLPAEAQGILATPDNWDGRQEYTVLFGQGVSQSTLQTVRAYQTIANNGVMVQPRLIESYTKADGTEEKVPTDPDRRVVSEETAQQVQDVLESAVTEGQVKDAAVPGYRVGAKTGTSQSPCDSGGGFCGYTASLIGMAPMDDPRFVVEVVLQRPKGSIYGITNGPVFRAVMGQALRTYNVAPSTGQPAHLRQYAEGFVPSGTFVE